MNTPDHLRPYAPVVWRDYIDAVCALKALHEGRADAGQQRKALDLIIYVISNRFAMTYIPDSDRDSAFAAGKVFVGEQILKLIHLKADEIDQAVAEKRVTVAKRVPQKR